MCSVKHTIDLKVDWATAQAAQYACRNWHYSKTIPLGAMVKIGAWENGSFIGVVIFSHGSNYNIGAPYGLTQYECVELTRVALTAHKTPVSRIIAIAIKLLKKHCPDLQLIVSFADPEAGHHGGIYQAGGWVYVGETKPSWEYRINGERLNKRAFTRGPLERVKKSKVPNGAVRVDVPGKHRYLFPMSVTAKDKIAPLSLPYPKRTTRPKQATVGTTDERQCNADPGASTSSEGIA